LGISTEELLDINQIIMNSLAEQLTTNQLNEVLDIQERFKWISLGFVPLFFLIIVNIIASIINLGCVFSDYKVEYSKLVNIVLKALLGLYQAVTSLDFQASGNHADIQLLFNHNQPLILHVIIENKLEHYVICYPYNKKTFKAFHLNGQIVFFITSYIQ